MREEDFPDVLEQYTYLDSACMSLRPESVIRKVEEYYRRYPGCPGRSNHGIAERASSEILQARENVAELVDAPKDNLVFTSGTTESINTVSRGFEFGKVFVSDREHNSNILPWQQHDMKIMSTENGLDTSRLESDLEPGDLVSLVHVSNVDGYEIDIEEIAKLVKRKDAYIMVDAAQSIPHQEFSVKDIEADFVAFSGHKMLGPSGTGGLYVSGSVKHQLEPLKVGGGAVHSTSYRGKDMRSFPYSMEPGLPNIAGIVGFGEAANYIREVGLKKIEKHEEELSRFFKSKVKDIEGVEMLNPEYDGVFSLVFDGIDVHEASLHMDKRNIAVRSGQHCAHPYFDKIGVEGSLRLSFYIYNNKKDVRKAVKALKEIAYLG